MKTNYPKFLKESCEVPVTFRIIFGASFGIELNYLTGCVNIREVINQHEISKWESEVVQLCDSPISPYDIMFIACSKEEISEAMEKCEEYIKNVRINLGRQFTADYDSTGGIEY